jgi:hypothetical protein
MIHAPAGEGAPLAVVWEEASSGGNALSEEGAIGHGGRIERAQQRQPTAL